MRQQVTRTALVRQLMQLLYFHRVSNACQPDNFVEVLIETEDESNAKFLAGQSHQGVMEIQPSLVTAAEPHHFLKQTLHSDGNPGDAALRNHGRQFIQQMLELIGPLLLFSTTPNYTDSFVDDTVEVDELCSCIEQRISKHNSIVMPLVASIHQSHDYVCINGDLS